VNQPHSARIRECAHFVSILLQQSLSCYDIITMVSKSG
jgi:hypothetical protein